MGERQVELTPKEFDLLRHINRLRAKIEENPENPQMVLTVWGIGYKFSDEQ